MKDYFAVLGEPRQPWLDTEKLQERYRQLSLTSHPDRLSAASAPTDFASVSEAHRTLIDPKLRLQHLLQLEGTDADSDGSVPESLLELFPRMGNFIARTTEVWQRWQESGNALARSLLQTELVSAKREVQALLEDAKTRFRQAEETTRSLNDSWRSQPAELAAVYRLFGFLTRWIAQLEEWKFRLDNS